MPDLIYESDLMPNTARVFLTRIAVPHFDNVFINICLTLSKFNNKIQKLRTSERLILWKIYTNYDMGGVKDNI